MKIDKRAWILIIVTAASSLAVVFAPESKHNFLVGIAVFCVAVSAFYLWRINTRKGVGLDE